MDELATGQALGRLEGQLKEQGETLRKMLDAIRTVKSAPCQEVPSRCPTAAGGSRTLIVLIMVLAGLLGGVSPQAIPAIARALATSAPAVR